MTGNSADSLKVDVSKYDNELAWLIAKDNIHDVVLRYCRGIDRRDPELVRSCYHPDASDFHGDYHGDVDGFVDYVSSSFRIFESTMHFLGNSLIEPAGDGAARAETYAVAYHRLPPRGGSPARDLIIGCRYIDDFALRNDAWRIARRAVVLDWRRLETIPDEGRAPDGGVTLGEQNAVRVNSGYVRGRTDRTDLIYAPYGSLP